MIAWMENQPMLYFNFCQDQLRLPKNTSLILLQNISQFLNINLCILLEHTNVVLGDLPLDLLPLVGVHYRRLEIVSSSFLFLEA